MSFCRFINDLPPFIITDILSRLPTKTIIHCKCVCKSWRNILLDPYFANLHFSKSPSSLIIHQLGTSDVLKLVEFQDECGRRDLRYDPVMKFDLTACCPNAPMHLVVSVNGLLCFCDYENESLFICNPTVRQYVSVPEPKHRKRCPLVSVYGFGFSSNSGQYKLVQINQKALYDPAVGNCSYEYRGEVYTLGSGKWRSIGTVPFMFSLSVHDTISNGAISNGDGVTLNGNIHWLNCDPESSYSIYYFDIDNESFQGFSSVPGLSKGILCKILVILEGRLCVSDNSSDSELVIWVMKEYGVSESGKKSL